MPDANVCYSCRCPQSAGSGPLREALQSTDSMENYIHVNLLGAVHSSDEQVFIRRTAGVCLVLLENDLKSDFSFPMKTKIGLVLATLFITIQWLTVVSFMDHSYSWWLKAGDRVVTAGISGTIFFTICSGLAILFLAKMNDKLQQARSALRYLSQILMLMGLAGVLVFWGMIFSAIVLLVNR